MDEEETKHGASQTNAEDTEGQSACVVSQDVCVWFPVCVMDQMGWGGGALLPKTAEATLEANGC